MKNIEVAQATAEDMLQISGKQSPYSFQGYSIRMNGVCVAIGGVFLQHGQLVAFTDFACPVPKRYVVKAARLVVNLISKKRAPVLALRDESRPTAHSLLSHFGFEPLMNTPTGEVYKWQCGH